MKVTIEIEEGDFKDLKPQTFHYDRCTCLMVGGMQRLEVGGGLIPIKHYYGPVEIILREAAMADAYARTEMIKDGLRSLS